MKIVKQKKLSKPRRNAVRTRMRPASDEPTVWMEIPNDVLPEVLEMIEQYRNQSRRHASSK
jgi:hypothetical protein